MEIIIYSLRNKRTDDVYVGQTANLHVRIIAHKTRLRRNPVSYLSGWKPEEIEVTILEKTSKNEAILREQYWIDLLKAVNVRLANGGHTEKSRAIYNKTWHKPKPPHVKAAALKAVKKLWKERRNEMLAKTILKQRKLTKKQVLEIRQKIYQEEKILNGKRFRKNGLRYSDLAKEYGVSTAIICLIKQHKRYVEF